MDNNNSNHSKHTPPLIPDDLSKENHLNDVINDKKSLDEVKKTMEALIVQDPFKDLRKSMKALYIDPLQNLRKSMRALYIEPFEDLRKSMKTLYIDPLENIRKSMKVLYIDPLEDLRKSMKTLYIDPLEDIRKSMQALYINPLEDLRNSMNTLYIKPLEDLRRSMKALYIENPLKELRKTILKYNQITDAYKNVFINSIPANTFEEAYQEVLSSFLSAQSSRKHDDKIECAIQVVDQINHQAKTFPLSKLSLEFYLTLLISLIFFLYSMHLSEQSELRITESINKTETIIVERLREFTSSEDQEIYW
mgnify:CR=1 FL=1